MKLFIHFLLWAKAPTLGGYHEETWSNRCVLPKGGQEMDQTIPAFGHAGHMRSIPNYHDKKLLLN